MATPRITETDAQLKNHDDYLDGATMPDICEISRLKDAWVNGESIELPEKELYNLNGQSGCLSMHMSAKNTCVVVYRAGKVPGPNDTEFAFVHLDPAQPFRGWEIIGYDTDKTFKRKFVPLVKARSKVRANCYHCGFYTSYNWRNQNNEKKNHCQYAKCGSLRLAGGERKSLKRKFKVDDVNDEVAQAKMASHSTSNHLMLSAIAPGSGAESSHRVAIHRLTQIPNQIESNNSADNAPLDRAFDVVQASPGSEYEDSFETNLDPRLFI